MHIKELSSATLLNWKVGMMEYWVQRNLEQLSFIISALILNTPLFPD
jgi:hypothetical protein